MRRSWMVLGLMVGLSVLGAFKVQAQAVSAAPWEVPTEVEVLNVVANRPGPTVWVVRKGAGKAYVVGSVSPMPDDLKWDSARLEEVISRSDAVIHTLDSELRFAEIVKIAVQYPLQFLSGAVKPNDIYKYKKDKTLRAEIGDLKYEELSEFLKKYGMKLSDYDNNQPLAPIFDVTDKILIRFKMSNGLDAEQKSQQLAKKLKKKVIYTSKYQILTALQELKKVSATEQMQCFVALKALEQGGVARHQDLAREWATGASVIYEKPATNIYNEACLAMSPSFQAATERSFSELWSVTMAQIEAGKTVTVVVPAHLITRPNGLLETLKASGAQVLGPPLKDRR